MGLLLLYTGMLLLLILIQYDNLSLSMFQHAVLHTAYGADCEHAHLQALTAGGSWWYSMLPAASSVPVPPILSIVEGGKGIC